MEGNKISFGFKKTKKADKPVAVNNDERKEYIECVEEQSIKVVGGETEETNEPLVIPMKPNSLITSERLMEIALKVESALEEPEIKTESVTIKMEDPLGEENETLDQMAERELMQEAQKEIVTVTPTTEIPTSTKGVAGGEKESTLDDYEAIPVKDFGVAMLRGMGWKPGQEGSKYKQPELRPKGLGLGADKVVKAKQQASKDSKPEELVILKNSYVKIVSGKYSDYYGKVVSLDEDNGRVVVDIPVKKEMVSLSEFMMNAVTKSEYDRESKVINADSYGEYKRKEQSQKSAREEGSNLSNPRRDGKERDRRDEKERERRDEKERDRRDEKERDRRDEKERDRRDNKESDGKERDRKDEKERERRDEKERDRRDERERDRRDVRERDRRDEREPERRERKKDNDSGDYRRQVGRDQDSANGKGNSRYRRDSSSSEDKSSRKKKEKKRYSSNDSLSSLSDDDRKQSKHKSRKRRSRSRSDSRKRSPALEAKRDIDKKRKGKKKKRDRDRSPNYKKHRK